MFIRSVSTVERRSTKSMKHIAATVGIVLIAIFAIAPAASATYPDRNGLIAFAANTGSGSQIYTVRPNGHDLRQITRVEGDAGSWTGRRTAAASCSSSTRPRLGALRS